jgi:hypothetical protein
MPTLNLILSISSFDDVADIITALNSTARTEVVQARYENDKVELHPRTRGSQPIRLTMLGEKIVRYMRAHPGPHNMTDVAKALFSKPTPKQKQLVASRFITLSKSGNYLRRVNRGVYEAISIDVTPE